MSNQHGTTNSPRTVNRRAATKLGLGSDTRAILLAAESDPEHLLPSLLDHAHAVVVEVEWVPVQDVLRPSNVPLQHVVIEFVLLRDKFFRFNLGIIDVSDSCFRIDHFHEMGLVTRYIIAV